MKNFIDNKVIQDKIIQPIKILVDKYPLAHQFIKFCIVGVTNLSLYLAVFWLITRLVHLHYIIGSIGGFIVAVTWSFAINLHWTFKHKEGDRKKQYIKFIISNIISMCINLVLLAFFIEVIKLYDILAQLICSFIVAFFNFGLNKFWTFKK